MLLNVNTRMIMMVIFVNYNFQMPLKDSCLGEGTLAMKILESRAASSLGLAGDAGEPLLLALALLNAAEVSWLTGRQEKCQ